MVFYFPPFSALNLAASVFHPAIDALALYRAFFFLGIILYASSLPAMSMFGGTQQQAGTSLFGNTASKPSPFGAATSTTPTSTLFGGGQTQQPASTGASTSGTSMFGSSAAPQQQPSGGLFGNTQTPQNTSTTAPFGQTQPQGSAFGSSLQKPQGSMFSGGQQQTGGLGGLGGLGSTTQPQTGAFGQQQPQQSQFGQTTMTTPQPQQQQPSLSSSLWSPGRAITGGGLTVEIVAIKHC